MKTLLIAAALMVIAPLSSCEAKDDSSADQEANKTEYCKQFSEESDYKYLKLTGMVVRARKSFLQIDCFEKGCADKYPASFKARMISPSGETFGIITKPEIAGQLKKKSYYMQEDKTYNFCARQLSPTGETSAAEKTYQIDDTASINLIEQVSRK